MTMSPRIRSVIARLVSEPHPAVGQPRFGDRLFRPLVVGPVLMRRPAGQTAWLVRVSDDGRLLPRLARRFVRPTPRRQRSEPPDALQRLAAALVAPQDLAGRWLRPGPDEPPPQSEFYGWSLMYQLPAMRNVAIIDPHERFPELPAFFESPLELIDRSEFLASRGIPTRPIALITRPADFIVTGDGRRRNRFYPGVRFRRPAGPEWFA